MIKYSHVSFIVLCDATGSVDTITTTLGVEPTRIKEDSTFSRKDDVDFEEVLHYTWMLDSPKSHDEGDPTARLYALADVIEPFASRLPGLLPQFRPWVDILYHVTPQHSHGVRGEFDWFRMPAELMRRFGAWDLGISYEMIWFDHPEWASPKRQSWLREFFGAFKKLRP